MQDYGLVCIIAIATLCSNGVRICCSQNNIRPVSGREAEVEDNSQYKTFEANTTLLKMLVDTKHGVSKSEVFDMLHSRDDDEQHAHAALPNFPEDEEDARVDLSGDLAAVSLATPDSQAEFLQAPGELIRRDSERLRHPGARAGSGAESVGTAAGIMVLLTVTIVCLTYTALIVWRRIFLKKHGLKHELLQNEEENVETRIEL